MRSIIGFLSLVLASVTSVFAQSNTVAFDNQSGEPALVRLVGPTSNEIEVPTGSRRSVPAAAGRYFIKVRYGTPGNFRYSKGDGFDVSETSTARSETTITLHKVVAGNYGSQPTTQAEFDTGSPPQQAGPTFGQSFNVILDVSGDSYKLDGYSEYLESRAGSFSPRAVLVIGIKDGVTLGGQKFPYGSIVVVEGTQATTTYRLAGENDQIILRSDVSVLGQKYPKGMFRVPLGGTLAIATPALRGVKGEGVGVGQPTSDTAGARPSPSEDIAEKADSKVKYLPATDIPKQQGHDGLEGPETIPRSVWRRFDEATLNVAGATPEEIAAAIKDLTQMGFLYDPKAEYLFTKTADGSYEFAGWMKKDGATVAVKDPIRDVGPRGPFPQTRGPLPQWPSPQ
jgi:hypothetical protein